MQCHVFSIKKTRVLQVFVTLMNIYYIRLQLYHYLLDLRILYIMATTDYNLCEI